MHINNPAEPCDMHDGSTVHAASSLHESAYYTEHISRMTFRIHCGGCDCICHTHTIRHSPLKPPFTVRAVTKLELNYKFVMLRGGTFHVDATTKWYIIVREW